MIKRTIILVGPPGAGKGYYSHWLTSEYQYKRLSSGDISRKYSDDLSSIGEQISNYLKEGRLVPDELISEIFFREISAITGTIIIDGFPRTLVQEKFYLKMARKLKLGKKTLVIFLSCSEKVSTKRVAKRQICAVCGASFHPDLSPSLTPNVCDFDKTQLLTRNDATKNTERWKEFREKTFPLIELFKKDQKHYEFYEINTEQTIAKTKTELSKILDLA